MSASQRIENYALIGDCETAALVSKNGSIDWLCWPRFSSGACFAALVGVPENGFWKMAPAAENRSVHRKYLPHTLVLETTFELAEGVVQILDFMPQRERHSALVRIVRGLRGKVTMRMDLALRFDYGRTVPWVTKINNGIRAIAGPDMVQLHTTVPLRGEKLTTVSDFTVAEGESISFTLMYGASYEAHPNAIDAEKALQDTVEFWEAWCSTNIYRGEYADAVERSLITLKALTYKPTGGVVAAATTSLPEMLGGTRNWDYRYCWLRDTAFTLLVLMNAGYRQEAIAWKQWLLRAVAGSPEQIQTLYGVAGERQTLEWEVPWLSGYAGSKPVRVGNAAAGQFQLDVFGEVIAALYHTRYLEASHQKDGMRLEPALMEHMSKVWMEPDEGIWEVRSGRQHFTYSKVMAWLAFDRAIKRVEEFGEKGDVDAWRRIRQQIHDDVCAYGFDHTLNSFVQTYHGKQLDASCLLIALVGFLPPSDPRIRGTVEAIERHLMPGGLVLRYDTSASEDGLPPGEGVFLACSFWMVCNLVLIGREEDAKRLFEKLLALGNDVGLFAEEYDTKLQRLVGNFPQALSHIALVQAAFSISGVRGKLAENGHAPGTQSVVEEI